MSTPKRKRYDYVGAVYGGVQMDMRGDDLQQSVKRILRKLVREAVRVQWECGTSGALQDYADRIAKELIP